MPLWVWPLVDLIYVMYNITFITFTSFPTSPITRDVIKLRYQLVSLSWMHCHHCNFKFLVSHFFIILVNILVPFNCVDLWTCFIWKEWIFFPPMSKVITSIVISKVPQNILVIAIWVLCWFIFLVLIEKSLLGLRTSSTLRNLASWLKHPQYMWFPPINNVSFINWFNPQLSHVCSSKRSYVNNLSKLDISSMPHIKLTNKLKSPTMHLYISSFFNPLANPLKLNGKFLNLPKKFKNRRSSILMDSNFLIKSRLQTTLWVLNNYWNFLQHACG